MTTALKTYLDTLNVSIEATEVENTSDYTNSRAWDVIVYKKVNKTYFGINVDFYTGSAISEVTREDVIYALISDTNTLEHGDGFEVWADMLGYNSDSIKDKKTYDLCVENATKLASLLTPDEITILNDLYTDY
jgi:hypothetical protein